MSIPAADGPPTVAAVVREQLLAGSSLEMTGDDAGALVAARHLLTDGTRVNITFLAREDLAIRIEAARTVVALGLTPVPHIAARRMRSEEDLQEHLSAFRSVGAANNLLLVGGDPASPLGPFASVAELLRATSLADLGVQAVSLAGYPEGHPKIDPSYLVSELATKLDLLRQQGISADIVTQFSFDADAILGWIERTRKAGVQVPIRIGVPGPAGVNQLLRFARRFGVASSAAVVRSYGLSLTGLLGTTGPDRLVAAISERYSRARHGEIALHFYTFGGIAATARWIMDARDVRALDMSGETEERQ
ncbi:methylenetetrahydrofolate reductase [Microbacterium sp. A8/3-1]|uniref:Methylenetetrahydrofolate reductase n=1 Tax=Microbacterium sp. A8/3-1 TaxID=3160749 RepID=A0AAU7W240_9MICO